MIDRQYYDAVLADLKENRKLLISNLTELNQAIETIERLYAKPAKPLSDPPARRERVIRAPKPDPEGIAEPTEPKGPRMLGLVEAIQAAAAENKWDQPHLAHRAVALRPDTLITSAQSQICALLKDGRLHKGEDLIIRNVKDGKIQGLPPVDLDRAR